MLRNVRSLLLASVALHAGPVLAADQLKFGKPPEWVVQQPIPLPNSKSPATPVAILLIDQQIRFEPGKTTTYSELAMKLQTAEGLAAGNLSLPWNPATDTITINKLQIHRGNQVIDVLASQSFTTIRRESNLELAKFDGVLTGSIQPEGLQQGDVIDLATTTEHVDPVLGRHVEGNFMQWGASPIQVAHVHLDWPDSLPLKVQAKGASLVPTEHAGRKTIELSQRDVEPIVPPKGAPSRFNITRFGEATDFASWADLATLTAPLYRKAETIPAAGPLHDEVEKIRSTAANPKQRAERALQLVQDRVRYVALLMGPGGYVPADAETTWSRRFGDCKAKTALLLGLLHSLGIEAEPIIVQSQIGDAIPERLPLITYFDHVLVRAHVDGKTYFLDGTRTADSDLDAIDVPHFDRGWPPVAGATLVAMTPPPRRTPNEERHVDVDASAGVYAPAAITITEISRGDSAIALNNVYSALTGPQKDEVVRRQAVEFFEAMQVTSSSLQLDTAKREFTMTIKGTARLNWKDYWLYVPTSSIAFTPDLDRPAGPIHDAPVAVSHPRFASDVATFKLPPGFASRQKLDPAVHETLAGVEYSRSETVSGDMLEVASSERSLVSEVPYKEALASAPRLKSLSNKDIYIGADSAYQPTQQDLAALKADQPQSANEYFIRAYAELIHNRRDDALADLNAGIALDPKDAWSLRKRAWIYMGKYNFPAADADLQASDKLDPGNAETLAFRGQLALGNGDIAAATAAFDQALQKDQRNSIAHGGRADVLLQQGRVDEALSELTSALASDPNNANALALRATIFDYRNDRESADRDLNAALAADPDNAAALTAKASIAVNRKDYVTAKKFVAAALAQEPNNSVARALQAALSKREGDDGQALRSLDAAIANSPHDITALLNRASALVDAKKFDLAEKDVASALALEPGNLRALKERAEIARTKGDFSGVVSALTTVLVSSPSDGSVLEKRAEAYRQLSKFDLALADTDAAMKAGLVSPELRLLRINILVAKGDVAGVAIEVDRLVKENPTSDFAFVAAGKVYAAIGMRDKAMASFDRALAIRPYAYIYLNRSQVRSPADIQGRLADIEAALKLEPDQEDTLAEKARLLSKAGKHAEAIQLYDEAMKLALDGSYLELSRAIALQKAGRAAEAKSAFDAVYRRAKTAGDFNRICWAKALDDVLLESALEDCRHAIRLDSRYPDVNESLGLVLLKLGKLQEALSALNTAVERQSGAETYLIRAIVRSRLGDHSGAHADATEARRRRADVDDRVAEYGLKFAEAPALTAPATAQPPATSH
jgi:tetratricopeptide (TPR) repeat protein/transglutaminase-like putative cysteine protease